MSDARERGLGRLERWGLRFHLLGCRSCQRYGKQLEVLDQLMKPDNDPAKPVLPADARQRILDHVSRSL